jgi:phage shock protein A
MALLERVATLLRANLNDLIDRAEDPIKMMRQVILDMENQLLQVKTQVAIAIADQHLLERKRDENRVREQEWVRKAEMAIERRDEELARAALERSLGSRDMAKSFEEQMVDQKVQVENLKSAMQSLHAKLAEARTQVDLLMAKHRRARAANRAAQVHLDGSPALGAVKDRIDRDEAIGKAKSEVLNGDGIEERFAALEKQEEVDRLLAELKSRNPAA